MTQPRSVVFDCNVCFQALISRTGPSAACIEAAAVGRVRLFSSDYCVREIRDVASRDHLRAKFGITDDRVEQFVRRLQEFAKFVTDVPSRYVLPSDPDDSHYINLALATDARLVVSRDRDLLRLMATNDPDGAKLRALFPAFQVMRPEALLQMLGT